MNGIELVDPVLECIELAVMNLNEGGDKREVRRAAQRSRMCVKCAGPDRCLGRSVRCGLCEVRLWAMSLMTSLWKQSPPESSRCDRSKLKSRQIKLLTITDGLKPGRQGLPLDTSLKRMNTAVKYTATTCMGIEYNGLNSRPNARERINCKFEGCTSFDSNLAKLFGTSI